MSDDLGKLMHLAALGRISRRDFLDRAAALGIAAPLASQMLAHAARAQTPRRGGNLIMGLQGGASTDSLDPAT